MCWQSERAERAERAGGQADGHGTRLPWHRAPGLLSSLSCFRPFASRRPPLNSIMTASERERERELLKRTSARHGLKINSWLLPHIELWLWGEENDGGTQINKTINKYNKKRLEEFG